MKITRRQFIRGSAMSVAAAGVEFASIPLLAQGRPIPLTPSPEVDEFKRAQEALLRKYGVSAQSRYVKIKNPALTVHVLEAGRGEPVLLLHGGVSACSLAPLLGALQDQFRLSAPDRPGGGLTDGFDYRDAALPQHAVDFISGVMDALELPKAALIGHSMGGLWAIQFALVEPQRVKRLALVGAPDWSSPAFPPPSPSEPTREGIRALFAERLVVDLAHVPDEFLVAHLAAKRLKRDVIYKSLREQMLKQKWGTYHLRPELKNLQPPAFFIWGDKDKYGPSSLGEEMARMAPTARCEVLQDAGDELGILLSAGVLKANSAAR